MSDRFAFSTMAIIHLYSSTSKNGYTVNSDCIQVWQMISAFLSSITQSTGFIWRCEDGDLKHQETFEAKLHFCCTNMV